jgi:hypothetical protein
MSLLYHSHEKADLKHRDYGFILAGFILALVCLALGLVVASSSHPGRATMNDAVKKLHRRILTEFAQGYASARVSRQ